MDVDSTEPGETPPGSSSSFLRPLQLGVLGCELGRTRYGSALVALPSVRIAALSDENEHYARVWARELGGKVPVFTDAESLLEQPLDAVLVAAPLRERAEQTAASLRAGKPTLAEIPFALSLADCDDLLALSTYHRTLLLPALPRRLDPYFQAVTAELDRAAIGALHQVRCAWSFPIESVSQEADVAAGGWNLVLQTLACQTVDLCRRWLGAGTTITADVDLAGIANVRRANGRRPQEGTLANIIVAHAQGQSTHQMARGRSIQPDERYILTGAEGNMELVISAGATASTTSTPNLRRQRVGQRIETITPIAVKVGTETEEAPSAPIRGRRRDVPLSPAVERMRLLLAHFAACVLSGATPAMTGADARAALEIVHAAYVSSAEHTKVTLPLRRSPDITGILNAFNTGPRALPPSS
jgi:predicted dehydrogenase